MVKGLLLDTDVLIDYLRGRPEAVQYIDTLTQPLFVSAMTVAELYAGVREGKERSQLESFLRAFEVVPIERKIAEQGGLFRRDYGKSHGTGLADAIIAATAQSIPADLVSLNKKHFPMLKTVIVPYRKS
jgi:predicted nucleic acid-binding protein